MGIEPNVAEFLPGGVEQSEDSMTIAYDDSLIACLVSHRHVVKRFRRNTVCDLLGLAWSESRFPPH